ncbi:MAG: DNA adenine methylase [Alphaproteobacteria bacterium]|nr:DNA adenine methylase [Alphaproteobacteria bacterium]
MQPILKYPGAKWRIAGWIIESMPPHVGYLEPYAGSLAVLLNKRPSRIETVNDLDGAIVRFFRTCRNHPDELARVVSLTPWARMEYDMAEFDDENEVDDVEAARRFLVRSWMAFGSCMSKKTGWRNTTGKQMNSGPDNPKLWMNLPERITAVASRLMSVQIENRPALELINRMSGTDLLMYVDPPMSDDPERRTGINTGTK